MLLENEALQAALCQEINAYAQHIPDQNMRQVFTDLYFAVQRGEIAEEQLEPLGHVLAMCLETGRVRRLYGPHIEMLAERLFTQTPQGQRVLAVLHQANQALSALAGQTLEAIDFSLKGPGSFYLSIHTDRGQLRLLLNRGGVFPLDLQTV
ncbi:hypothetical protein HRbin36_00965 [bacterium HR36]|nr:hypothetical protein HRbin36_00965 [bacterium HR36]